MQSPTFTAVLLRGPTDNNNDSGDKGSIQSPASPQPTGSSAMARDNVVVAINNMRKSITGLTRGLTRPRTPSAAAAAEGST